MRDFSILSWRVVNLWHLWSRAATQLKGKEAVVMWAFWRITNSSSISLFINCLPPNCIPSAFAGSLRLRCLLCRNKQAPPPSDAWCLEEHSSSSSRRPRRCGMFLGGGYLWAVRSKNTLRSAAHRPELLADLGDLQVPGCFVSGSGILPHGLWPRKAKSVVATPEHTDCQSVWSHVHRAR